jgi:hypothetical protein
VATDDDDDPAILDWGPDALTTVDQPHLPDVDTAKYKSLEYATGREAGFSEGVDRVLSATARALLAARFTVAQASVIVTQVEQAALRAG